MKFIEKLILCCIWICIAVVAVLIRDQMDLNQRILKAREQKPVISVPDLSKNQIVVFNEHEVMEMVAERIPAAKEAMLEFRADGIAEVSLTLDDTVIEQAQTLIQNEVVSALLPVLKGASIACEVSLTAQNIDLIGCETGLFSVPDELLGVVETMLNETWNSIVNAQKIEQAFVDEDGLKITMEQE